MERNTRRTMLTVTCFATLLMSLVPGPRAEEETVAVPQYTVTNLGTLGGTIGTANGINNERWVTGDACRGIRPSTPSCGGAA